MSDPVCDGLVASLARPGGNITGLTTLGLELTTKLLDLLSQALPGLSRVVVLWLPGAFSERTAGETWKATEQRQPVCVCSFDGWMCSLRTTSTAPSIPSIASGPRP